MAGESSQNRDKIGMVGAVFTWGKGEGGRAGHGEDLPNQLLPTKIDRGARAVAVVYTSWAVGVLELTDGGLRVMLRVPYAVHWPALRRRFGPLLGVCGHGIMAGTA